MKEGDPLPIVLLQQHQAGILMTLTQSYSSITNACKTTANILSIQAKVKNKFHQLKR